MNIQQLIRRTLAIAGTCAALAVAPHASALSVDGVGDSFSLNFYGNGGALNATANFSVSEWDINGEEGDTSDHVWLAVDITNNSLGLNSRLTALSILNISPNLTWVDATDGWDAVKDTNAGGGFNPVELCLYDGSNCNGGSNEGVPGNGSSESFNVLLNFSSLISTLSLDGFVAKFQTDNGSFHINGCVVGATNCAPPPPPTKVPEPGTLGMLGLGLLGLAGARRKKTASAN